MRTFLHQGAVLSAIVAVVATALCSCQTQGAQVQQSPLPRFFERTSGMILYIAADGNLNVIDQKGGGRRALTADATATADPAVYYSGATWSPDGRSVAYARLSVAAADQAMSASLFTQNRDGSRRARQYSGTDLQPIYLSWSPDSRRVTMLSSVPQANTLELGISNAGAEGGYRALDRGQPYYWDWRNDGRSLVVHVNIGQSGASSERISVLNLDAEPTRSDIAVPAGIFQAPNISPDGKNLAYVSTVDGKFALHLRSLDSQEERIVANDDGGAYFAFSRDGTRIAYLAALAVQPVPQGTLTVVDLDGKAKPRTVTEGPVLAFFWAPNGRSLAFIVPESAQAADPVFLQASNTLYVRLMGCDVVTGKTWLIARFPPSRGIFSILPFFDQYQRSATIWSPDSRFVMFTALSADGSPGVYVAQADGNIKPRFLAAGDFAFWSWK